MTGERRPTITLLSDFGLVDAYVGIVHGVIASICPDALVIDLSHGIPRHDVRSGAHVLAMALAYLPVGVHLAVVDPGVGGDRRGLALELEDGRFLVGPDNGLLWPAAQAAGGVRAAVEISRSPVRLQPTSATFHGRDVFAPVAAHLAAGTPLRELGESLAAPPELVTLEGEAPPVIASGLLIASATYVDSFGNVALGITHDELAPLGIAQAWTAELALPSGRTVHARCGLTFDSAPAGELLVYEDSSGALAIAVSQGSAADELGLRVGDVVTVRIV